VAIVYRHYKNYDNPGIVALWNTSMQSRGCCKTVKPFFLETQWFCKPWFQPQSLSLALDEALPEKQQIVGLSLAGFGANADETGLDSSKGVISLVLVHPNYRRKKLGTELIRRAETFLKEAGSRDVRFGCNWDRYPYCWGMIGSISPAGVLQSMPEAHAFIQKHGYQSAEKFEIYSRALNTPVPFGDPRFPHLRRKFELRVNPRATKHWFDEAIHSGMETMVFELLETAIERPVASLRAAEMTQFIEKTEPPQAGLYALEVKTDFRGQGLAKFLLAQTLQHLSDQLFQNVETVIPSTFLEAQRLFTAMGFVRIDEGISYAKTLA
jgi:ribosomal protein S18 acetylase RimI-like enzyme